jgi:N-acetylglucosaminyl-diphospho-decaprenol L-rhamnosyltransferase
LDRPQGVRQEVIVVDNASTDGAAAMVEREFPEVILVRNGVNAGFARANNQAAQRGSARYLFFLNNDTIIPPGTLRRLIDYADAHPEVGMLGPRLRDVAGQVQVSYRLRPTLATLLHRTSLLRWTGLLRSAYRRYRRDGFDADTTRPVDVLMGAAVLLPRERFFQCGCWDEEYVFGGEDVDLSIRINREGQVVYLPDVEITHLGRVSTRQHIGYASTQMAAGFVRFLRKSGYSRAALVTYKLAVTLDAPIQLLSKSLQYGWRRILGRHRKAQRSRVALCGIGHFLFKGIAAFWKA